MSHLVENYLNILMEEDKTTPSKSSFSAIRFGFMALIAYAGAMLGWAQMKDIYKDLIEIYYTVNNRVKNQIAYVTGRQKDYNDSDLQQLRVSNYLMKKQQEEEHGAADEADLKTTINKAINITIATTAIVGVVSTIAYKIYKAKFGEAAKACKQYTGLKHQQCIKEFKMNAINVRITGLEKGMEACQKLSKSPNVCKQELFQEIKKQREKLKELGA